MKLKDIGTIVTGNTPSKRNNEYYESDDILFVKPSDIEENYITNIESSEEYISEKAREKARILPEGAVLVTCIGTIGKVGILSQEATCNQQINAIIPNDKVISKYLAYLIQSKQKILKLKANAPVVPIINKTDFSEIEINICDVNKQKEIVDQLDLLKTIIDKRKIQIEELQNIIKSQFVEMFENKNIEKKTLQDITIKITDGSHNPPNGIDENVGYMMLSSQNIVNDKINYENARYLSKEDFEKENARTDLKNGDVLLTIVGTVGRTAIISNEENITLQRSVAVLKPIEEIKSEYLVGALKSDDVVRQLNKGAKGVAQKGIYLNDLKKLTISVPPIELQNKFADFVKQIDKQKFEIENSLKEMQELYESLMEKYFG
ncbi:MAG TPA: restriction endonuclease subunit S [Clostridiaceae bacterium]|nr:restriction endonuclease subunit S [Clostridiaceae bacterium]